MGILLRIWAIFVVATKRLFSQRWLALATMLGLIVSVALTMSIPLYADAVYYRILREGLAEKSAAGVTKIHPPFAFMFQYIGAWAGTLEWEDTRAADDYLSGSAGSALGLPQKLVVRYFTTDNFQLFPQADIAYADVRDPLVWSSFGFVSDLENHITILEGEFPAVAEPTSDSTIEILVGESLANDLGLQVNETYIAYARRQTEEGARQTIQIPVHIAGIWRATDPKEEFWFYNPESLQDVMLVPEQTFWDRISPYMRNEVYLGVWYLILDGSDVHASDVGSLLTRIRIVQQRASALLPGIRLGISPVDALTMYQKSSSRLTFLLYAFSVPIVGLILAFIGLVVGLSVARQRSEIAVLRSRGATAAQVVGITMLEGVLVGAVALGIGTPLGTLIAHIIGRARSFLDFALQTNLRVGVTMATLRFGLVAIALALVTQVLPAIGAARHTIVTYKQERARESRRPWWQRAWLDLMLLIPAAYGVYLLKKQGSIAVPLAGGTVSNDPFQNPLLFLVPALGIFALTLFILRILPVIMAGIAWISSRIGGVGILLATRHLSRTPGLYSAPLVLLVLTLSLSAFTASLAQTLDHHLYDQTYYKIGADMRVVETGECLNLVGIPPSCDITGPPPHWSFLPVSEHLRVPGVQAAARVGRYPAITRLSGGTQTGTFFGIDRTDFPNVAFWRRDFAPRSLGSLMNALALDRSGVLVSRSFMGQYVVNVGDTFRLAVDIYGQRIEMDVKVVGGFDLFPTWYPQDEEAGPLFVGNLDYLFEQAEGESPYNVWLKTDPRADYSQIERDLRLAGFGVINWNAPRLEIAAAQQLPERQGLFGVLSVGFVAAALLTVLGFLLYAFFSFRRRFIELGILRAVGLSSGQMTAFLAWELVFLILTGAVAGTALGAWVSNLFIPYLQVGSGAAAQTPPFVVEIAWPAIIRIYTLFGLLFFAALGGLAALLLRMKIFQAVKLGETM